MPKLIDLTGRQFGHWTVIRRGANTHDGWPQWDCRCSCGIERTVRGSNLKSGISNSCGHINVGRRANQYAENNPNWKGPRSVSRQKLQLKIEWATEILRQHAPERLNPECKHPKDDSILNIPKSTSEMLTTSSTEVLGN